MIQVRNKESTDGSYFYYENYRIETKGNLPYIFE